MGETSFMGLSWWWETHILWRKLVWGDIYFCQAKLVWGDINVGRPMGKNSCSLVKSDCQKYFILAQLKAVERRLAKKIQSNEAAYEKHQAEIENLHGDLIAANQKLKTYRKRIRYVFSSVILIQSQ